MEPDFTIVTPSFNYGKYIEDCLRSVQGQEGATLEHLIFDGGSTDDTAAVAARFPDAVFRSEPDRGMCDAINKGFRRAAGKWVMWLNADDRLLPGALAAVKNFAEEHADADVIYGGWNFIDADGKYLRRMTLFPYQHAMMLYLGCYIGSTATFLRRSTILGEGHLLNEKFRYVMDGELYARLGSVGKKFVYFPKILGEFRLHGGNLSKRNFGSRNADEWLQLQHQFAETRAFRRTYGRNWFNDENLNGLRDAILYLYFRALKPLLKLLYAGALKK